MSIRKVITTTTIICSLGAVIYGIYFFYKRQIALALQYCYKLDSFRFLKFDKNLLSMEFTIKIQNRSNLSCILRGYNIDVILNEKKLATLNSDKEEILNPNSISKVNLVVNVDPKGIFNKDYFKTLLYYYLTDRRKIVLHIKGYLKIKMNFINKRIRLDINMNLKDLMTTDDKAIEEKKVKCDII